MSGFCLAAPGGARSSNEVADEAAAKPDTEEDSQTSNQAIGQPSASEVFENLTVVGSDGGVAGIPGSAHFVTKEQLDEHEYFDIHRILQNVPGVNVQDEDGWGRRPNIGMRGTGTERSSKITVLEDGVLVAPAPYAAPAAYYFPVPGRMESVEVRKGSSSIRQGPFTNGGVLNLVSSTIPGGSLSGRISAAAGQDSLLRGRAVIGGSKQRYGWLAETYQFNTDGFKDLDGGGDTGFDLEDYLLKFRLNSAADTATAQTFDIKLGHTEESSRETYLGLSDGDFDSTPFRRYAGSQADTLDTEHQQIQARYFLMPTPAFSITATAYRNEFFRNWHKLQSVQGVGIGDVLDDPFSYQTQLDVIRGDSDSDPGELKLRNNRRDYYAQGVEGVLELMMFDRHDLMLGVRVHEDEEDRFQEEDSYQMLDGSMVFDELGRPGSQSNRIDSAEALAFFVQDQILLDRWTISPGIRLESIDYTRSDYGKNDPARTGDDLQVDRSSIDQWIPGIGVNYQINTKMSAFVGVHKGFSPPGPGSNDESEPEESVNYELGWRYWANPTRFEVVAFYNDYDNLLGRDTLASGGTGEGELFNGGAATIHGLELSATTNPDRDRGWNLDTPMRFAYTYTHGQFDSSFESDYQPWKPSVEAGDELPYLPEHQASASFGLAKDNWSTWLSLSYMSKIRTSAGSGPIPPDEGIDARVVADLSAEYRLPRGLRIYGRVRNLTDETYAVARRPAGLRPGLNRTVIFGVGWDF